VSGTHKSCIISETVQDYYYGLIGSHITYALSIGTNINDLGWPWTAETPLSQK